MTSREGKPSSVTDRILSVMGPTVTGQGYDLLEAEYMPKSPQGGPVIRLFIDRLVPNGESIGIEDCITVDRAITALIEDPAASEQLPDDFTLEVSSPGIDRPLTRPEHYTRYAGKKVRLKTFGPLTAAELGDEKYFALNPKQKNFVGTLVGIQENQIIRLQVDNSQINIPFSAVAKAHLDIVDDVLSSDWFKNAKAEK